MPAISLQQPFYFILFLLFVEECYIIITSINSGAFFLASQASWLVQQPCDDAFHITWHATLLILWQAQSYSGKLASQQAWQAQSLLVGLPGLPESSQASKEEEERHVPTCKKL